MDKVVFDELYNENITKKRYNEIVKLINQEVNIIWRWIIKESKRKLVWYDFLSDYGDEKGFFDPDGYKDFIELNGEFTTLDSENYQYNYGFPTYFLWSDYQKIVKKEIEEAKAKDELDKKLKEAKREKWQKKREGLILSIKSKLTKKELSIIFFKN